MHGGRQYKNTEEIQPITEQLGQPISESVEQPITILTGQVKTSSFRIILRSRDYVKTLHLLKLLRKIAETWKIN